MCKICDIKERVFEALNEEPVTTGDALDALIGLVSDILADCPVNDKNHSKMVGAYCAKLAMTAAATRKDAHPSTASH